MSNNSLNINTKTWGILGVGFLFATFLINSLLGGISGYGYNMYGGGIGFGLGGVITSLLLVVIKLLWFVFVVSLVIGIAVAFRKNIFGDKQFRVDFVERFLDSGHSCPSCGESQRANWKYCPACGTAKAE